MAEALEQPHAPAGGALRVPAVELVGAELLIGRLPREEGMGEDKDLVADGDDGLAVAAVAHDAWRALSAVSLVRAAAVPASISAEKAIACARSVGPFESGLATVSERGRPCPRPPRYRFDSRLIPRGRRSYGAQGLAHSAIRGRWRAGLAPFTRPVRLFSSSSAASSAALHFRKAADFKEASRTHTNSLDDR